MLNKGTGGVLKTVQTLKRDPNARHNNLAEVPEPSESIEVDENESFIMKLAMLNTQLRGPNSDNSELLLANNVRQQTKFTLQQLQQLKELLERKNADGTVGMEEKEFVSTFGAIFYPGHSREQLQTWFERIDTGATGRVDWDEFSAYLLLLGQRNGQPEHTANSARKRQYVHVPMATDRVVGAHHKELINGICINAHPQDRAQDRFFTTSFDGAVKVWDSNTLEYETTLYNSDGVWLTDICYLPHSNRVAVSQVDRLISLFDCSTNTLQKTYKGGKYKDNGTRNWIYRDSEVTSYDVMSRSKVQALQSGTHADMSHISAKRKLITHRSRLELVMMSEMLDTPMCLQSMPHMGDYMLVGLDRGHVQLYNMRKESLEVDLELAPVESWQPHKEWVTRLCPAPAFDGFISSSADQTIQVWSMEKGESIVKLGGSAVGGPLLGGTKADANNTVQRFAYSQEHKIIASCGSSRRVLLWNPVINAPLEKLQEHKAPLVDVLFNEKHYELLTLADDKVLKVWDIRTFKCMQTLVDKELRFPEDKLSFLFLDKRRDHIVTGSNQPMIYRTKETNKVVTSGRSFPMNYKAHIRPIVAVATSDTFNQVITCDGHTVIVWDSLKFTQVATWASRKRIVAMALDINDRRLITADNDTNIYMWNYVSGQQLKEFVNQAKTEISALHHTKVEGSLFHVDNYVVAAGLSNALLLYVDNPKENFHEHVANRLSLHNNGNVTSMRATRTAVTHQTELMVGTDKGILLGYSLSTLSLLHAFSLTGRVNIKNPSRDFKSPRPNTAAPRPAPRGVAITGTGGTVEAEEPEQESDLLVFQQCATGTLVDGVDALCFLAPHLLAVSLATGEIAVWKLSSSSVDQQLSFKAAHTSSDNVSAMTLGDGGVLWVGDTGGFVSGFVIVQPQSDQYGNSAPAPGITKDSPSTLSHFDLYQLFKSSFRVANKPRAQLDICYKAHDMSILSISWLSLNCWLLTASTDCFVRIFDTVGVPVCTVGYAPSAMNNSITTTLSTSGTTLHEDSGIHTNSTTNSNLLHATQHDNDTQRKTNSHFSPLNSPTNAVNSSGDNLGSGKGVSKSYLAALGHPDPQEAQSMQTHQFNRVAEVDQRSPTTNATHDEPTSVAHSYPTSASQHSPRSDCVDHMHNISITRETSSKVVGFSQVQTQAEGNGIVNINTIKSESQSTQKQGIVASTKALDEDDHQVTIDDLLSRTSSVTSSNKSTISDVNDSPARIYKRGGTGSLNKKGSSSTRKGLFHRANAPRLVCHVARKHKKLPPNTLMSNGWKPSSKCGKPEWITNDDAMSGHYVEKFPPKAYPTALKLNLRVDTNKAAADPWENAPTTAQGCYVSQHLLLKDSGKGGQTEIDVQSMSQYSDTTSTSSVLVYKVSNNQTIYANKEAPITSTDVNGNIVGGDATQSKNNDNETTGNGKDNADEGENGGKAQAEFKTPHKHTEGQNSVVPQQQQQQQGGNHIESKGLICGAKTPKQRRLKKKYTHHRKSSLDAAIEFMTAKFPPTYLTAERPPSPLKGLADNNSSSEFRINKLKLNVGGTQRSPTRGKWGHQKQQPPQCLPEEVHGYDMTKYEEKREKVGDEKLRRFLDCNPILYDKIPNPTPILMQDSHIENIETAELNELLSQSHHLYNRLHSDSRRKQNNISEEEAHTTRYSRLNLTCPQNVPNPKEDKRNQPHDSNLLHLSQHSAAIITTVDY